MSGWKPVALSFSSGGVLVGGQLGIMAALIEAGVLDEVREWHGCSCGAMAAYVCALGVTPGWMRTWAETQQFSHVADIQEQLVDSYLQSWGLNYGSALVSYISQIIDT